MSEKKNQKKPRPQGLPVGRRRTGSQGSGKERGKDISDAPRSPGSKKEKKNRPGSRGTSADSNSRMRHEGAAAGDYSARNSLAPLGFSQSAGDYEIKEFLGYSNGGNVFEAKYTPTGERVAVKMIDCESLDWSGLQIVVSELRTCRKFSHPNIGKFYGAFIHGTEIWVIMRYMGGGSVAALVEYLGRGLEEQVILYILREVLLGLKYLHEVGYVHRNVKANNILLDVGGVVQVFDFRGCESLFKDGRKRSSIHEYNSSLISIEWAAPEVLSQNLLGYDTKSDIYSLGITALEMAVGCKPYVDVEPTKIMLEKLRGEVPNLAEVETGNMFSSQFSELINDCLQQDPAKRPSAAKLLERSIFKKASRRSVVMDNLIQSEPDLVERVKHLTMDGSELMPAGEGCRSQSRATAEEASDSFNSGVNKSLHEQSSAPPTNIEWIF
eukprot:Nk52_evm1s1327 gene=Nk52_evmTU1s1327